MQKAERPMLQDAERRVVIHQVQPVNGRQSRGLRLQVSVEIKKV